MKSKSKKQPLKRKHEFRNHAVVFLNRKGKVVKIKHPAYVFFEQGNIYYFVQLTHSSSIQGKITIQLRNNPNPKDNRKAFYIAKTQNDKKDSFGKKKNGWRMNPEDDKEIRQEFEKTKKDDSADKLPYL